MCNPLRANLLGLSEQVPMKVVFLTDGPSRLRLAAAWNGGVTVSGDGASRVVCARNGEVVLPVGTSATLRLAPTSC